MSAEQQVSDKLPAGRREAEHHGSRLRFGMGDLPVRCGAVPPGPVGFVERATVRGTHQSRARMPAGNCPADRLSAQSGEDEAHDGGVDTAPRVIQAF